ncbi:nucleotidyltransferase family protein [Desulfonatronum thioautotrophicum]|uniref:nucleotidyltransferase family protein n=1 Tax=Desulfonatronum thioautotrophicum TaxID=617001 RepID=UPI0006998503|nr:nucleotidyltransferase family protein [Desulfonatronum thioautotrophicum]
MRMDTTRIKIAGIVLAGGAGRRMGGGHGGKLLLPYRSEPLVVHVLRKALAVCDPVVAVTGCNADAVAHALRELTPGLRIVHAPDWQAGQARSLRAGLDALVLDATQDIAGALVFLGDQPLVRVETLEALAAVFRDHPRDFVAPRYHGKRGNPVCIPRAWFARVMALEGDVGARPLLDHPDARLRLVDVMDSGVHRDVDTLEDYHALLRTRESVPVHGSHPSLVD